jgi:hypothetical protein
LFVFNVLADSLGEEIGWRSIGLPDHFKAGLSVQQRTDAFAHNA